MCDFAAHAHSDQQDGRYGGSTPLGTFVAGNFVGREGPVEKVDADPTVGPDFFSSANAVEFSE